MSKSLIYTYIGAFIALVAILAGVFGWVDPQVVWGVAGIFGFGSVASLRTYIDSQGWKTYVVAGIPIVLGILLLLKVIDLDTYKALVEAFTPLTGMTVAHGVQKAQQPTKIKLQE